MAKSKSQKVVVQEDKAAVEVVSSGDQDVLRPTQKFSHNSSLVETKEGDFRSEGVTDNDVFLLPGSDYQVMIALTVLAAAIRLFRIYQPSSVVFDEVQ